MNNIMNILAIIGRIVRQQLRFMLIMIGASWGVMREMFLPSTWRRTVIIEFWRNLRQIIGGGLFSVIVVAVITGFGLVAQAIFWLGFAGLSENIGSILSSLLVRELAPILIGIILLGRSGMLMLTEIGDLTIKRRLDVLTGMGIDPFLAFIVPRSLSMTVGSFTLGVLFSAISLGMGYIVCWMKNLITQSIWSFFFQIANSVPPIDYVGIPLKFLLSGFVVGLSCCLSSMDVTTEDDLNSLIPRGFARGILSVMLINVAVDMVLSA